MSDTDELLREVEAHTGEPASDRSDRPETDEARGGVRSRAADRAGSVFSPRALLVSLVLVTGGLLLAGAIPVLSSIPVVGQLTALLGVFAGALVHGLAARDRRYVESGVAGGVVAGVASLAELLFWTLVGVGVPVVLVVAAAGAVAGVLGHYFGRDLRSGLTRDL